MAGNCLMHVVFNCCLVLSSLVVHVECFRGNNVRLQIYSHTTTSWRAATERPPSSQRGIRRCCSLFSKGTESTDDGDSSSSTLSSPPLSSSPMFIEDGSVWESLAGIFADKEDPKQLKDFVQYVTLVRVGIPSLFVAGSLNIAYPYVAIALANAINDSGVFAVVAQDSSQYIQNILTTSGLVFSLLVGQTYYFMYQQQEAIYLALFDEVTVAKSLLEQVALVCQGRDALYQRILQCIDNYVRDDLMRFNDMEPAILISDRPSDDPLEDILYLTSVGEPSIIYSTVRSLRQARAYRLGALQRKLPPIHMFLLWTLACIVLFTFPLLGAGVQTVGGMGILYVQQWYLSFIVFGICLTMGVIYELQRPGENGAYNARMVLSVMVAGLEEELDLRLQGKIGTNKIYAPSVDSNRAGPQSQSASNDDAPTPQQVAKALELGSASITESFEDLKKLTQDLTTVIPTDQEQPDEQQQQKIVDLSTPSKKKGFFRRLRRK